MTKIKFTGKDRIAAMNMIKYWLIREGHSARRCDEKYILEVNFITFTLDLFKDK